MFAYVPQRFRESIQQESDLGILDAWNSRMMELIRADQLGIRSVVDLKKLSAEELSKLISSVPTTERHDLGLKLFLQTYQEMRRRYGGQDEALRQIDPEAWELFSKRQPLAAAERLLVRMSELKEDFKLESSEDGTEDERTYATDHTILEEERWGFGLFGTAFETTEKAVSAMEKMDVLRRAFLDILEAESGQISADYFGVSDEEVREETLNNFSNRDLERFAKSFSMLLRFFDISGVGNHDIQELSELLIHEKLSAGQFRDVIQEAKNRIERIAYVWLLWFGGRGRQIAARLGDEKVKTFLRISDVKESKAFSSLPAEAENKIITDLLAEEGLTMFQQFLDKQLAVIEALEKIGIRVSLQEKHKGDSRVITFKPGSPAEQPVLVSRLGNKGAMLVEMSSAGFPVPPGFILPPDYLAELLEGKDPAQFRAAVFKQILNIEREARRHFPFNPENLSAAEKARMERSRKKWEPESEEPLIVSVRSGSFVPLPGILDTFLDLPVTHRVFEMLIKSGVPKKAALDDRRRYLNSYATVILGLQEAYFSRFIRTLKDGLKLPTIRDLNDEQMEDLVRYMETEIRVVSDKLKQFATIPLDQPGWRDVFFQYLTDLRGESKTDLGKIHTTTYFDVDYETLSTMSDNKLKPVVEAFQKDIPKRLEGGYEADEFDLLLNAIREIVKSWDSPRAKRYRLSHKLSNDWKTPVTVQMMAFGNRTENSGAFVAQTHDLVTGVLLPDGYYKKGGQGEDLVAGRTEEAWKIRRSSLSRQQSIEEKEPGLFLAMMEEMKKQSHFGGGPRQIEGVIQKGKIFILQNVNMDLVGKEPGLIPKETDQPVVVGAGENGGARHVRLLFDAGNFTDLKKKISQLRMEMDKKGEKDIGIALVTGFMTAEEAEKLTMPGLEALLVSTVGGGAHATVAAREAGITLISSLKELRQNTVRRWTLKDVLIEEGMAGKIYSIDGNLRGPTAGHIYEGLIPIEKLEESSEIGTTLKETIRNRVIPEAVPERSEMRKGARDEAEVRAQLKTLAESTDTVVRRRAEQFLSEPLVSGGRKGASRLSRARTFINETSVSRSETRVATPASNLPGVRETHRDAIARLIAEENFSKVAFTLGNAKELLDVKNPDPKQAEIYQAIYEGMLDAVTAQDKDAFDFRTSLEFSGALDLQNPEIKKDIWSRVRRSEVRGAETTLWQSSDIFLETSRANKLWEGIHERNPDWQRMNALLSLFLGFGKRAVSQQEVVAAAFQVMRDQGLPIEGNGVLSLLNRLAELGLIKKDSGNFRLAVHPRIVAVKADDPFYIKRELKEAMSSPEELERIIRDYSKVTSLWPLYPIESRWPVLRAAALLDQEDQEALVRFLNDREAAFGTDELVDSILLMFKGKSTDGWLKKYAPHLMGRTIYYDSPETVLLAGGLGRVGQFHTSAAFRLAGKDAEIVLREPRYHFRLLADNETEEPLDYANAPKPVRDLRLFRKFNVTVRGKTVPAKAFVGTAPDGMKVYLIDGGDYYTRLLYRYDNAAKGWVSYSDFVEFFTRADIELTRILEEERQAAGGDPAKAPVIWVNDGQMGPAAAYKAMLDR
ncbi:MAG: PEP/pyruvate-binding domain-containing protein, partial [Candidatus Omnitrophica bacterium]|nr:PEP/pyruvate-binding domain-containing protein [Candidatus Omnitrophota bacterium]